MQNEELKDNVFDYIQTEKTAYETRGVPLASNWDWHMPVHIERSFLLKNSKFSKGNNDGKRPNKNIILPIVNVQYRTEGFDVKDIELFVNDSDNYHKSLLARKFHTKWAKKYSIDTAIDDSVESYVDYGLTLVKNVNDVRPEIVPLQRIAFCDQTDILSGPICEKHQYSVDQLDEQRGKWYDDKIDEAILQAKASKNISLAKKNAKTPGKYIEIYELHGIFPKKWLNKDGEEEYTDEDGYSRQIHIVTFYKGADGKDTGICLFKGKESKSIYKALKRTNRFGSACGMGGIEELFDPQKWVNSSEIYLNQMLEATSKVILKTTDTKLKNQKLSDIKNGHIFDIGDGKMFEQLVFQPINKAAFDNYVNAWEQNARTIGSASDPQLGLNPVSGTPLGTTEIVTNQGEGIHEHRRGKIAIFWGEIYRDWILKHLADEMNKGDKWLDELTLEELQEVAEKVSTKRSNKRIKDLVLSGKKITKEEQDLMRQVISEEFMKEGKKRFLEMMKDEFKNIPLDVDFNIAGKQKNLYEVVNKLNGVFRSIFANPAILQAPGMGELFNQILEMSGLSPVNFSSLMPENPKAGAVLSPIQAVESPELVPNQ